MSATAAPKADILGGIAIASPCPASWDDMAGDDRVRFCRTCRKNVYNLSGMTSGEAEALVEANEGSLCARLYRRRDGTVLTADCPEGIRRGRRRRRKHAAFALVATAFLSGVAWAVARTPPHRRSLELPPSGPGVTLDDWADWALATLGLRRRPVVMGAICRPISAPDSPLSPGDFGEP